MKQISSFFAVVISILLVTSPLFANHTHDHIDLPEIVHPTQVNVEPNEIILETEGIVCSFCAFGAQKKLSKLKFIDKSEGKDKAIHTNIQKGLITLKIRPGAEVNTESIAKAVKSAGYKVTRIHLSNSEVVEEDELESLSNK